MPVDAQVAVDQESAGVAARWGRAYRCFRRPILEAIRPETLTSTGPSIVQEVLFRVHRAGATIREIPLTFVDRKDGDSKLGLGLLLDGYFMILRLKMRALLGRNP